MKSLAAAVIVLALTGCATTKGLEVSLRAEKECAEAGCTPWSDRQILELSEYFYKSGLAEGLKRGRGGL